MFEYMISIQWDVPTKCTKCIKFCGDVKIGPDTSPEDEQEPAKFETQVQVAVAFE